MSVCPRAWQRFLLLLLLLILASPLVPARARADEPSYTVGEFAYKILSRVDALADQSKYAEAQEQLNRLVRRKDLSAYERGLVSQRCGYLETYQSHPRKAAACFELAVKGEALPVATRRNLLFNLAQIYLQLEENVKGVGALERWLAMKPSLTPERRYLLAVAYMRTKNFAQAERWAKEAVTATQKPRESWLQLLLSVRVERERYAEGLPVAVRLLRLKPGSKAYWVQVAGLHDELGHRAEALAVRELMYEAGLLVSENELLDLAQRYVFADVPRRAAVVLEKALASGTLKPTSKNLLLIGEAWLRAREPKSAVEPLERAAAMAPDGRLYLRLAKVHLSAASWDRAIAALEQALRRGGLESPGRAHLLVGQAHFSAKRYAAAKAAFDAAARFEETKREASQWKRSLPPRVSE